MKVLSLQLHATACGVDQAGHKQESIPPNLQGSVGLIPEQPQVAHKLLAAAVPSATADFLQTSLYASGDCSGTPIIKSFSYIGCSSVGTNLWATASCSGSTAATVNVFQNAQCTGTSTPSTLPLSSSCSPGSTGSSKQICVTGAFAAPPGVISTNYSA
jgi:hypothetical protein